MPKLFWHIFGTVLLAGGAATLLITWVWPHSPPQLKFELVDQNDQLVTENVLVGRPTAVFLGFTSCLQACPIAMSKLSSVLTKFEPNKHAPQALFISVDPTRDTPDRIAQYLAGFRGRIVGLGGAQDSLQAVIDQLRGYVKSVSDEQQLINHTTYIYLFDSDGRYVLHLGADSTVASIFKEMKLLLPKQGSVST